MKENKQCGLSGPSGPSGPTIANSTSSDTPPANHILSMLYTANPTLYGLSIANPTLSGAPTLSGYDDNANKSSLLLIKKI